MKITDVGAALDPQWVRELVGARAEIVRLTKRKDECSNGWDGALATVQRLERELAEVKEQLRLCNIDQFTTAAELAEAIAKERERCARVCISMADDFELEVNQRGLVDRMKQHFGVK